MKEKPPTLAEARLQGTWVLEFSGAGGARAVVNFDPACREGPCDVTLKTDPVVRLRQKGTLYKAKAKGSLGSTCTGDPIKSVLDLSIRVRKARMQGSKWLAQSLIGTLRQSVAPQKGCSAAKQTYKVKGTPTSVHRSGRNDLPAIALVRPLPPPSEGGSSAPRSDPFDGTCVDIVTTTGVDQKCF